MRLPRLSSQGYHWVPSAVVAHATRQQGKERHVIRKPIAWPTGARCAVAFTFDMDAESLLHVYFPDTAPKRPAMASILRYGPEGATPRIVVVLKRYGLRQTFFIPRWCVETYPDAVDLILQEVTRSPIMGTCTRRTTN